MDPRRTVHYFRSRLPDLIGATLQAVDPHAAIRRHVRRDGNHLIAGDRQFDLRHTDKIVLVAAGKAAFAMATAIDDLVGDRLTRGVIVTKYGHAGAETALGRHHDLVVLESGHPIPDRNSLRAGELVVETLVGLTEHSLVMCAISGGASALMIAPQPGIRLETMQAINEALLRIGADIREINTVRSRLERLKGGGLVRLAAPAQVLSLVLSDVIGDPLDIIASGLTNDPRAYNLLVANNTQACEAAAVFAQSLGFEPRIVTTELRGEARVRGQEIAQAICASAPGSCLVYGGEPTVTLQGTGKGGRNQELALSAALLLSEVPDCPACVSSFGTDGTDGPTDAAGATAASDTISRARAKGLDAQDYLACNDSYHFFRQLGDLIMTGPTGTNVADVVVAVRGAG